MKRRGLAFAFFVLCFATHALHGQMSCQTQNGLPGYVSQQQINTGQTCSALPNSVITSTGTTLPETAIGACTSSLSGMGYTLQIIGQFYNFSCTLVDPTDGYAWVIKSGGVMRRVGATTVQAGQPVSSALCSSASNDLCIVPPTTSAGVLGITLKTGTTGQLVPVVTVGIAPALFSNTPVQNDSSNVSAAGLLVDTPVSQAAAQNTIGYTGKVQSLKNIDGTAPTLCGTISGATCAFVALPHPNAMGQVPYTKYTATFTPAATATSSCAVQTITGFTSATGATLAANATVFGFTPPSAYPAVLFSPMQLPTTTAGSVSVTFCNINNLGTSTAPAGTYSILAFNQ